MWEIIDDAFYRYIFQAVIFYVIMINYFPKFGKWQIIQITTITIFVAWFIAMLQDDYKKNMINKLLDQ
jgi:hypothetical protein